MSTFAHVSTGNSQCEHLRPIFTPNELLLVEMGLKMLPTASATLDIFNQTKGLSFSKTKLSIDEAFHGPSFDGKVFKNDGLLVKLFRLLGEMFDTF